MFAARKVRVPLFSWASSLLPLRTKSSCQSTQVCASDSAKRDPKVRELELRRLRLGDAFLAHVAPPAGARLTVNDSILETRLVSRPSIASRKFDGSHSFCFTPGALTVASDDFFVSTSSAAI